MASPDLGVFGRIKTKQDFDREAQLFALERQKAMRSATGQDPAAIKEWNAYNSMPAEDQQRYLQMKRADQIMNLGGQMAVRNPLGGIQEQYTVTPKMSEMPEFEAMVSGAQASAKVKAEDLAKAQMGMGQSQENTRQLLDTLDSIENSKGLSAVVGMPNPLGGRIPFLGNIPGTPAADFQAKLDQLGGKQFLQAFESLKGGGAITEIEGQKATNAIASMQASQSEEAFRKSLQEFKEIVIRASERAQQKAQQDPMQQWLDAAQSQNQQTGGLTQPPKTPIITPETTQSLFDKSKAEFDSKKPKKRLVYNPLTGELE